MVAVFSSIGVFVLAAAVTFCVLAVRRRRRDRLIMEAIDFTPRPVDLSSPTSIGSEDEENGNPGVFAYRSDSLPPYRTGVGTLSSGPSNEMTMAQQQQRQYVTTNSMGRGSVYYDDPYTSKFSHYNAARQQRPQPEEWLAVDFRPAAPSQPRPAYDNTSRFVPAFLQPGSPYTRSSSALPFLTSGGTLAHGTSRSNTSRGERGHKQPSLSTLSTERDDRDREMNGLADGDGDNDETRDRRPRVLKVSPFLSPDLCACCARLKVAVLG
jgi:hypothetical protein